MDKKGNMSVSRRKVLKGSAAGSLIAFGSMNVAAKQKSNLTSTQREDVLRDYRTPRAIRRAVHQQSDVLKQLSDDGVLDKPTINDLQELTEPNEGVGEHLTVYQVGKRYTPQIKVLRRVDAGRLSLSVFPEEDTAHAVLIPEEDGKTLSEDQFVKYGNIPEEQVEPQDCWLPGECYGCERCYTYCCSYNGDGTVCYDTCTHCECRCSSDFC